MSTHNPIKGLTGVRGSFHSGSPDDPYIYFVNDNGKISRVRMSPSDIVLQNSKAITKSTASHNLDNGLDAVDVRWSSTGNFERRNTALIAQITPAPASGLAGILPETLAAMTINGTSFPESGTSEAGNFDAVKTTKGNLAKVRIYKDTSGAPRMDWVTYRLSGDPEDVGTGFGAPQDLVILAETDQLAAYVSGTNIDGQGCVFVAFSSKQGRPDFGWNQQFTIANGLDTPKQMVFEPTSGMLLLADGASLWAIDPRYEEDLSYDLLEGSPGGINGVAVTKSGDRVYISTETGNAIYGGKFDSANNRVTLDPQPLASNLGPVGFLRWADVEESALLVAIGDDLSLNGKKLLRIPLSEPSNQQDLLDGITTVGEPRSIELLTSTRFFVTSSAGVGELDCGLPIGLDVPLGLGFVPFQCIDQQSGATEGTANTKDTLPGYFFKVKDASFGGTMHFMVNHSKAWQDGHRYFQIRFVQNGASTQMTSAFTDLKWNSTLLAFMTEAVKPATVGSRTGCYPIRAPGDLWYNAHLGAILGTAAVPNGVNTLEITFLDADGNVMGSFTRNIRIENVPCRVRFISFLVNDQPLTSKCGVWQYSSKEDPVKLEFSVDYAGTSTRTYYLAVRVGSTLLASQSGVYNPATPVFTQSFAKLRDLMGKCNVATISAVMSISTNVTNGYGWIGGHSAGGAFALVPPNTVSGGFQIDEP